MAAGAAIGGVVGGVGSLLGSHSASKAAKRASQISEKYLKEAMDKYEKGIEGYEGSFGDYEGAWAEGMGAMMERLGYGDQITQMALGALSKGSGALDVAQYLVGQIDSLYDQGRQDLLEGKDYALDLSDSLKGISDDYAKYTQGMMDTWQNMFGDMRQNLIDTYSNMDPDRYSTQWKADIRKHMGDAIQKFDQSAARSGIYTQGMKQQAYKDAMFNQAEQFQKADLAADDYVRQQQTGFYGQFGEPARQEANQAYERSLGSRAGLLGAAYAPLMQAQRDLATYQQGWGSNKLNQANTMTGIGQAYNQQGSIMGGLAGNVYGTAPGVFNAYNALGQAGLGFNSNLLNAYGNMANMYTNASGQYGQSAAGYGGAAGSLFGGGLNMLGSGLGSLFG